MRYRSFCAQETVVVVVSYILDNVEDEALSVLRIKPVIDAFTAVSDGLRGTAGAPHAAHSHLKGLDEHGGDLCWQPIGGGCGLDRRDFG
ncbi:hypothetical protein ANO14919_047900 [Xylariales sp. No.14919]|nr:hypothetical protein ANO14919_047900 [Xylariales sp. No.14919]